MNTVPQFPEFRRITLDDAEWYDDFYASFPHYADFTFNNLVVWQDQYNDLSISRIDDILIFRCTSLYMNDQLMMNFIGNGDFDAVLDKIFEYMRFEGQKPVVLGVPEFIAKGVKNPDRYVFTSDRDNAEYIIDTRLLGTLEGPEMKRMRQLTNGYERDNADITVNELDMTDPTNREYLRGELLGWDAAFSTNETAGQERDVILRTLDVAGSLAYGNVCVSVGGKLVGFALYREIPSVGTRGVVVNHLKTSYGVMHTSYYLSHRLAGILHGKGYEYMNYEQDLGIEGLRIFKERLKPVDMLVKYNIAPL